MAKVKLVRSKAENTAEHYLPHFPGGKPVWGEHHFSFDQLDQDYDWLVVIDRLPNGTSWGGYDLKCPQGQTIFIATEPSSITYYGAAFVGQFGYIITNQDADALPHPNAWRTQPGSRWIYEKNFDEIIADEPPTKTKLISGIATNKQQKHTLHYLRFQFLQQALVAIPETDLLYSWRQYEAVFAELFGDRAKFVPTKCDMLDPYKYHLAIGNEEGPDILTERVTDALLGYSVPISFGCSNLADYFPADSYIDVDIKQPDKAIEQIEQIIYDEDDYARRLPAIIEARRRVIYEYNMIAMIAHLIDQHAPENSGEPGKLIPRRVSRLIHLKDLLGFAAFRLRNFLKT